MIAGRIFRLILAVDHTVDVNDLFMVAWQILGNTDPERDHRFIYLLNQYYWMEQ